MGPLCRMGTQVALRWGGRILSKKIKRSRRYPFNDPGPLNSMRHRCGAHCHLDLCHRDLGRGGLFWGQMKHAFSSAPGNIRNRGVYKGRERFFGLSYLKLDW